LRDEGGIREMRIHPMWKQYPYLEKDLEQVVKLIESSIRIKDQKITKTIQDLIHSGGKLLRPAYSLLCSEIGPEKNKERAIAIAAAVECLHMATLVHDDVIDDSDTRHGKPTVHTQNGNRFAIYTGDYLFSLTFSLLARYASSMKNLEFNSRGIEKILIGELEQLNSRYKEPTSVKEYLSRISGKTAQLFSISCYLGAIESYAPKSVAMHAWNMGRYIGMSFQIIDDILDYQGDFKTVGKPVLSDIRQGIYTLPMIYAMRMNPKPFKQILKKKEDLTDEDVLELAELVHKYKGVENAKGLAKKYTDKAIKELNQLPEGEYKQTLLELTEMLLTRKL